MSEIYDLRLLLQEHPTTLGLIEFFVQDALLHWSEEERGRARDVIRKKYEGMIVGAFMGDNQIFVEGKAKDGTRGTFYLRDMPATYLGRPAVVHPFRFG